MELIWIERMMIRELTSMEEEIVAVTEEAMLWQAPPGVANSIGNIALHLIGNLQLFIGAMLGKTGYVRKRDLEFSSRGVPRATLLAQLADTKRLVSRVLGPGATIDLAGEFPETVGGAFRVTTGDFLIHLAVHLGFHLGQAGYLRRILMGANHPVSTVSLGSLATARKVC